MKLYAIRDRMIDYYMVPFAAPNDNEAMAGIAHEVNREDITAAIQNSPHHFELYSLGELDENATIFPRKELVCDCSSLVRAKRQSAQSAGGEAPQAPRGNPKPNGGIGNHADAGANAV